MDSTVQVFKILSIAAFLFYGSVCLVSEAMVLEFERYGLARLRVLTGSLEVLGALSLLAGYVYPQLVIVGSGGLSLLMLMGVAVRVSIGDPLVAMVPALALFAVNALVLYDALRG